MMIENMMTHIKVNNEVDLCEIIAGNDKRRNVVRHKIEAALQYARISYFLRWQDPAFFKRLFLKEKTRLVICVNEAQMEDALQVIDGLQLTEKDVLISGKKSNNRYLYENK